MGSVKVFTHYIDTTAQLESLSILTRAFARPIKLTRILGHNPLKIVTELGSNQQLSFDSKIVATSENEASNLSYYKFQFSLLSWPTLYCGIRQLLYQFGTCLFLYRLYTGDYTVGSLAGIFKVKATTTGDAILMSFTIPFLCATAGVALTNLFGTPHLALFLNSWRNFIEEFSVTFSTSSSSIRIPEFTKVEKCSRAYLKFVYLLLLMYVIWAGGFHMMDCLFNPFDPNRQCDWLDKERNFIIVPLIGIGGALDLAFDQYKVSIMMETIQIAFYEIRNALVEVKSNAEHSKNGCAHVEQEKLYRVVRLVRRQIKLFSHIVGPPQLVCLALIFTLSITIWMMIIQTAKGGIPVYLLCIVGSIVTFMLGRFALFDMHAERILDEERAIMDIIRTLNFSGRGKGQEKAERELFISSVMWRPSEFVFGNMITFKRALILSIISGTTTYVIGILQLLDFKNSDILSAIVPPIPGINE